MDSDHPLMKLQPEIHVSWDADGEREATVIGTEHFLTTNLAPRPRGGCGVRCQTAELSELSRLKQSPTLWDSDPTVAGTCGDKSKKFVAT